MGRPTEEKKGKVVKVRVSDELYEEIEKQGGNISETIRGYIRDGVEGKKETSLGNVPQKSNSGTNLENDFVPQNIMKEDTLRELEDMCLKSGFTTERFFDRVYELFNEGKICVDGIQIKTVGEYDTRKLEEVCHRVNADPQEMIDRLTKSLMRG